ncbi:MAG: hypothetical protein AB7M93_25985 [Candidatus Obscuribacterales bacterium]
MSEDISYVWKGVPLLQVTHFIRGGVGALIQYEDNSTTTFKESNITIAVGSEKKQISQYVDSIIKAASLPPNATNEVTDGLLKVAQKFKWNFNSNLGTLVLQGIDDLKTYSFAIDGNSQSAPKYKLDVWVDWMGAVHPKLFLWPQPTTQGQSQPIPQVTSSDIFFQSQSSGSTMGIGLLENLALSTDQRDPNNQPSLGQLSLPLALEELGKADLCKTGHTSQQGVHGIRIFLQH